MSSDNPYYCLGLFHDDELFLKEVTQKVIESIESNDFLLLERSSFLQFSKIYYDRQPKKQITNEFPNVRLTNFEDFSNPFFIFLFFKSTLYFPSSVTVSTKISDSIFFSHQLEVDNIKYYNSSLPLTLQVRQSYFLDKEKKSVRVFAEDFYGEPFNVREYLDSLPEMPFYVMP